MLTSQLGWIHFSDTFRNRVNTILEMMEEEGTVDELGIGVFRDGLADYFFPGISTIQTRAKYFFIVPYLIQDYVKNAQRNKTSLETFLNNQEHEIMWYLAGKYNFNRRDSQGVIGITKRPKNKISRRPSSIYWNGIRQFDFIKTNYSLAEYSLKINLSFRDQMSKAIIDGKQIITDDSDIEIIDDHSIKVSTYKSNWKENLDLPLSYEEANFFNQRIKDLHKSTLLEKIASIPRLQKKFIASRDFSSFVKVSEVDIDNISLYRNMVLAHDLNQIVFGLHLVYSNEINKHFFKKDYYLNKWQEWANGLYDDIIDLDNLDAEQIILQAPKANQYSKDFLRNIIFQVKSGKLDYDTMAFAVIKQERNVKGRKSRFKTGVEADIQPEERKSLTSFGYRFGNAKQIIKDIMEGIKENA